MMKKKILFVTTSYGSFFDSQTIRYFQYLTKINKDLLSIDFIVPNCNDEHFKMFENFQFHYRVFKTDKFLFQKINNKFKHNSIIGKIIRNFAYYFFFPDTFAGFEKAVYRKFKEIYKNEKPDLLISSSGSCSSHLVCAKIKKEFNIKWISDFGDPWSITDYKHRRWFYFFSKYFEKKVFTTSNLVLFTTNETLNYYKSLYPKTNMEVLFYGYVSEDFSSNNNDNNKITIAHIGAAYVSDRNLIPSIDALSKYSQIIDFSIIGNHSFKFQEFANSIKFNVNFKDRISFEDSLIEINNTDVLILVGNKGELQIPGKVFHYIASNKIILYIYQQELENDPSYKILSQFKGVYFCQNNTNSIGAEIKYIIDNYDLCKKNAKERKNKANSLGLESESLGKKIVSYINRIK